ncbi:hypothetical protein CkaCkLH20_05433 [Colletotrichum karsti]|uniref:Mutanase n=1 Tax=Colletotrichum karsti TaxID=1095194 RepID=A0A9P6I584_9PEZI|nr:uncharacterized protein CkaCkLH20_05433 [Colletotrichum karsti]KAF9877167.1 hypothetical protein CkaCkLH20_05433 [Colletotrichum karsti]
MRFSQVAASLAGALSLAGSAIAQQRAAFAHYMLGTITAEHARKDIESAKAIGFDGFALNVGDPTASFVDKSLGMLFDAADLVGGFGLYISMDVWASGDACWNGRDSCEGPMDYQWIFQNYKGRPSYYQWNGMPVISTFSAADFNGSFWKSWKDSLANEMFFIPDFEKTEGYYQSDPGWWEYWGDMVDGVFSWESAWPERDGYGSAYVGDISVDKLVAVGAHNHSKLYMVPLSPLQYKNSYKTNVYRDGRNGMPMRMDRILGSLNEADFVQFLTWNDGPESHYIAELWPEQNSDAQPWLYMNQNMFDHTAWQPLVASFNHAFKNRQLSTAMTPQNGAVAVGAMWHRPIVDGIVCNSGVDSLYTGKPDGYDDAIRQNQAYWSVVLKPGLANGYSVVVHAGQDDHTTVLHDGLNYGNGAGNIQPGQQWIELKDPSGKTIMTARSKRCVSSGCPQGIYNMNYLVSPFEDGTNDEACIPIGTEVMPITEDELMDVPKCEGDESDWKCITCAKEEVTIFQNAYTNWQKAKADTALDDFADWWKDKRFDYYSIVSDGNWSRAASGFFRYNERFDCGLDNTAGDSCVEDISCHKSDGWSLAASLILTSMARINAVFKEWLNAVDKATYDAAGMKTNFINTFSYDPSKDVATQLNNWFLNQIFDVSGGFIFQKFSSFVGESELAESAWTEAYSLVVDKINKAMEDAEENKMMTVDDVEKMLSTLKEVQESTLKAMRAAYFNDADPSFFNSQVKGGVWLAGNPNVTATEIADTMKKVIYGGLIQQAWIANPTVDAVIIMADETDEDYNPFAWKGGQNGQPETLNQEDVEPARIIKDGKTFFLVGVTNCQNWKTDDGTSSYYCDEDAFKGLPGLGTLGSILWGGLEVGDMVNSSWAGYQLNGNANGYNISADSGNKMRDHNGNKQATLYPDGVSTPGVFSIPICDYKTAYRNFNAIGGEYRPSADKCEHYPCCTCEELDLRCSD